MTNNTTTTTKILAWIAVFPFAYYIFWLSTAVINFDYFNYWHIQYLSGFLRLVCTGTICALWALMFGVKLFNWIIGAEEQQIQPLQEL